MTEVNESKTKGRDNTQKLSILLTAAKAPVDVAQNFSKVKRNAKGGISITKEEIAMAFAAMDTSKAGYLTIQSLKKCLSAFYPDMTTKEYRFLMNNQKELTIDDIEQFVIDNEISNFDPVAEAFNAYDPKGTGFMCEEKLRKVYQAFGLGELTDEELMIIKKSVDFDNDGLISLEDFRTILDDSTAVPKKPADRRKSNMNSGPATDTA